MAALPYPYILTGHSTITSEKEKMKANHRQQSHHCFDFDLFLIVAKVWARGDV